MPGANPLTSYPAGTGLASPYQIALLAHQAGFPASQIPVAVAVALAESGGHINAANHNSNGTTDHGLWQINDVNLGSGVAGTYTATIDNPLDNARAALAVFRSQGWRAWTTYRSHAYAPFLSQGISAASAATASTANQIAGALLPLVAIGVGGSLPEEGALGGATAGEDAASEAESGTSTGSGGALSKGLSDLAGIAKAGGIAALLLDKRFLWRMVKIVLGAVLVVLGVRQLGVEAGVRGPKVVPV